MGAGVPASPRGPGRILGQMPGYETKTESIVVTGADNLQIRSLLDRQQFSDPLDAALRMGISSAAWPLFGLPWPSGNQLAQRMAVRTLTAGERILELGCGLGLPSLVAHRRGSEVTASDCHPLAGAFLRENLRLNGLPPLKYRHGHWNPLVAPRTETEIAAVPAVQGLFDLIIGSDLLYERDEPGDLAAFIGAHSAPHAEVWIVDPDRGNRPAFNRRMAEQGFLRREERLDIPATTIAGAYKGRVLIYRS